MAAWPSTDSTSSLAHFPPGFPLAVAATLAAGMEPLQGARLIEAISFGVTVAILALLVASEAGMIAGLVLGVALLVARPLVLVHLSVLSEPLFLALMSLTLAAMVRRAHPLTSGLLAALSALVRYAGIAVSGAVVLWQLIEPGTPRRRFTRAVLAGLPTLVLQGAWMLHTKGPTVIRSFGMYPGLSSTLAEGWHTVAAWLIPTSEAPSVLSLWLGALAVLLLVAVTTLGVRATIRRQLPVARLLAACAAMSVCYVVVIMGSRLTADPGIPFDERILAPLLLVLTVAVVAAIAVEWRTWGLLLRGVIAAAAIAWAAMSASASSEDIEWATTNGADFAGEQWRTSSLLRWARESGASMPLYSNWPMAAYFYLHRPTRELPNARKPTELRAFADTLARRNAVVIAFDVPSPDGVPPDSLAAMAHLRTIARLSDGTVYGPPIAIRDR